MGKRKREEEEVQELDTPKKPRRNPRRKRSSILPIQIGTLFGENSKEEARRCGRKLVKLNENPVIYEIENFLTEAECKHILKFAKQNEFQSSFTEDDSSKIYSKERTSKFIFFNHAHDSMIRRIETRVSDILGLTVNHVEPLQVVRYKNGEEFQLHHDAGTLNEETKEIDLVEPKRLATFFVYLNTLPQGIGHTEFPEVELSVRPEERKAVLWLNLKHDNPDEADFHTNHCATPVPKGHEKFGLNIWVTRDAIRYG